MLISISGIDGAGKTQLGTELAAALECGVLSLPDRSTTTGRWLDEYLPDAYVYGVTNGRTPEYMRSLEAGFPQPDVALLLEVAPEVALARIAQRAERQERYENERFVRTTWERFGALWCEKNYGDGWFAVPDFRYALTAVEAAKQDKRKG